MAYSYAFADANQEIMIRTSDDSDVIYSFPTDPANRYYAEFVSSGATAADYVAPPEPPEPTTEEKVDRLLSDYDLTRDELITALEIKLDAKTTKK